MFWTLHIAIKINVCTRYFTVLLFCSYCQILLNALTGLYVSPSNQKINIFTINVFTKHQFLPTIFINLQKSSLNMKSDWFFILLWTFGHCITWFIGWNLETLSYLQFWFPASGHSAQLCPEVPPPPPSPSAPWQQSELCAYLFSLNGLVSKTLNRGHTNSSNLCVLKWWAGQRRCYLNQEGWATSSPITSHRFPIKFLWRIIILTSASSGFLIYTGHTQKIRISCKSSFISVIQLKRSN